jgi:hypothetical protein
LLEPIEYFVHFLDPFAAIFVLRRGFDALSYFQQNWHEKLNRRHVTARRFIRKLSDRRSGEPSSRRANCT